MDVGNGVCVEVGSGVGVRVGSGVGVLEGKGVYVVVGVGVCVAVDVGEGVNVGRGVGVSVGLGVKVGVLVGIGVFIGTTTAAIGVFGGAGVYDTTVEGVLVYSNCVESQEELSVTLTVRSYQGERCLRMELRITSNFRIQAVRATFVGLPAASSR